MSSRKNELKEVNHIIHRMVFVYSVPFVVEKFTGPEGPTLF